MKYIIPTRGRVPRGKVESFRNQRRQRDGCTMRHLLVIDLENNSKRDEHCIRFKQPCKPRVVWATSQGVEQKYWAFLQLNVNQGSRLRGVKIAVELPFRQIGYVLGKRLECRIHCKLELLTRKAWGRHYRRTCTGWSMEVETQRTVGFR